MLTFASVIPRPCSSPKLPHADTHSRIEHYASRYVAHCAVLYIKSLEQRLSFSTLQMNPPSSFYSFHPCFHLLSSPTSSAPSPLSICHTLIEVLIWLCCALYSSQGRDCTAQQFLSRLLSTQTHAGALKQSILWLCVCVEVSGVQCA